MGSVGRGRNHSVLDRDLCAGQRILQIEAEVQIQNEAGQKNENFSRGAREEEVQTLSDVERETIQERI